MINAIISGIFHLITSLFDALLSPLILLVTALFPSLSSFFPSISSFLSYCFTYIRSILCLLLIPDVFITALFDYFIILYTIHLTIIAVKFAITIYNKFKI